MSAPLANTTSAVASCEVESMVVTGDCAVVESEHPAITCNASAAAAIRRAGVVMPLTPAGCPTRLGLSSHPYLQIGAASSAPTLHPAIKSKLVTRSVDGRMAMSLS
jgi:hypothetical protein